MSLASVTSPEDIDFWNRKVTQYVNATAARFRSLVSVTSSLSQGKWSGSGRVPPSISHIGAPLSMIPVHPAYHGLCRSFKFHACGWRNVSVNAFLGLIVLALVVSVGSARTEGQELYINVAARAAWYVLQWLVIGTIDWISWILDMCRPFIKASFKKLSSWGRTTPDNITLDTIGA